MPRPELLATHAALLAHFGARAFSTGEAMSANVSRARLRKAADAGLVQRLQHGRFIISDDPLARVRGHQQRLRDQGVFAVPGERSGAAFWRLWEFGPRGRLNPPPLTLLVPSDCSLRIGTRSGIRLKRADLRTDEIVHINGVAVTTPLRSGFDVARAIGTSRAAALVPLSSAVRTEVGMRTFPGWFPPGPESALSSGIGLPDRTPEGAASAHDITEAARGHGLREALLEELHRMCERTSGHGISRIRAVLADVEPLLESWLECIAWAELTAAPIPRPRPQVWIRGASGRLYRSDFLLGARVILEVDGAGKYDDHTPWQEKQRQADLEAAGYWVVRCTWEELLRHPERVIARIVIALERTA